MHPKLSGRSGDLRKGRYWPYRKERRAYNCPLDKTNHISWQKRRQRISSYILNGAVITGFSGQVHFITYDDFQREQVQNKPGLLWCVPHSPTGE